MSAALGLLILLGGCKSRPAPPLTATPTPRPTLQPTPHPTPKPLPSWRRRPHVVYGVQTRERVLALTFDDGPDPAWTPKVLAILQQTKTPATFFMVGKMVRAHSHFAEMVKAAHFPIGNHSWSHPIHPRSARSEVELTDAMLQKVLQIRPTLFRPPYGIMTNGLAPVALSRGEDVINWNSLGADWDKHSTSASIEAKVLKGARPGGITLLHDGGGNRARTVAALPRIIAGLRARGFRFVTVPELLLMGPPIRIHVATPPRLKKRLQHRKRAKVLKSPLKRSIALPASHLTSPLKAAPTPKPKPTAKRSIGRTLKPKPAPISGTTRKTSR